MTFWKLAMIASAMVVLPGGQAYVSGQTHGAVPAKGNVVMLGDSNTWLGGDDCTGEKGWNTWFAREMQPLSCHSYARSGATWTNTPQTRRNTVEDIAVLGNDNVIYNQICRLTAAAGSGQQPRPHTIIIMAGTNDAWFRVHRPQAFEERRLEDDSIAAWQPSQVLTLSESVRHGCWLLQRAFPEAHIVLVTPPQTTAVETVIINHTGDIIEQAGRQMGVPVVRLDKESCIDREKELQRKQYTYDGTHTSEAGARCIAHLIATRINSLGD